MADEILDTQENALVEVEACLRKFEDWNVDIQIRFVDCVIKKMSHNQQAVINSLLEPLLKRDFVQLLLNSGLLPVAEKILSYLDAQSLLMAESTSREWSFVVESGKLWKKIILKNVATQSIWKKLAIAYKWFDPNSGKPYSSFEMNTSHVFRSFYNTAQAHIDRINQNWRDGHCLMTRIICNSDNSKGVYCLQYDDQKIVSGLRDNTIKIWDRQTLQCTSVLAGHVGSVLCLQYEGNVIISGSSDGTVKLWNMETREILQSAHKHHEAVLHLRFSKGMLVTCSKDRTIYVWNLDLTIPQICVRLRLDGHKAAVNVVDFDEKYIVSASGDRTIKIWCAASLCCVRTLIGHRRGIACLQYRKGLIVSGSSDNTIRLWNVDPGECLRVLEGHGELVRCIRFDDNRILSGSYDGKIKVWDLKAALNPESADADLCVNTFEQHTGRVFRVQFDDFIIVSSSHDDTILIWDFNHQDEGYGQRYISPEQGGGVVGLDGNVGGNEVAAQEEHFPQVIAQPHPEIYFHPRQMLHAPNINMHMSVDEGSSADMEQAGYDEPLNLAARRRDGAGPSGVNYGNDGESMDIN